MKNNFFQLDILRALAVTLVVLFHFEFKTPIIPFWNTFLAGGGNLGVNIFFVISGFLISRPFVNSSLQNNTFPDMKKYATNRILRIVPLFWFIGTLVFIFKDYIKLYHEKPFPIEIIDYVKYYFFNYGPLVPLNPPVWTLQCEVLFYIFFPIVFKLCHPWHHYIFNNIYKIFIGIILSALVYRFCNLYLSQRITVFEFFDNLEPFLLGILLSFLMYKKSQPVHFVIKYPILLPSLAIVLIVLLNNSYLHNYLYAYPLFQGLQNLSIFMLFIGLLQKQFTLKNTRLERAVILISTLSYSIYLWHFNVHYSLGPRLLHLVIPHPHHLLTKSFSIGVTLLLSWISYNIIEKQFLKLKR